MINVQSQAQMVDDPPCVARMSGIVEPVGEIPLSARSGISSCLIVFCN